VNVAKTEPAAIAGLVVAIVNVVQLAALSLPTWTNTLIACVSVGAGAIYTRQNVTPTTSSPEV
jgi:hypothetical protein